MRVTIYLGILFLVTSCKNLNPHHGLYNALFYDYDKHLKNIDENLTHVEEKEKSLKDESQRLTVLVARKEKAVNDFELYLQELSLSIEDIKSTLNTITYDKKISKIKVIVLKIKEEINSQELFKTYLLKQRSKVNQNIDSVLDEIEEGNKTATVTFSKKMLDEGNLYLQYKK